MASAYAYRGLTKARLSQYDEALKHVSNPDDFALRFRGIGSTSDGTWDEFEGEAASEKPAQPVEAEKAKRDPDDEFIQKF